VVSALDRKLLRDLRTLRGQIITIALVVACGITSYITMRSAYDSLLSSRDSYYRDYRFADVFASLKRAPRALEARLGVIPGVARVETRVVERVLVPLAGRSRPASGTVVSLRSGQTGRRLNDIHIRRGRDIDPTHKDEVLINEGFADAHRLRPGDSVPAVINGTLRHLRIAGIALSPEYVMTIAPGEMSYDPGQSPILWMDLSALQAAFQMEGAFNDVAIALTPGAHVQKVLTEVDALLSRYGGIGAVSRQKQSSAFMLDGELAQLDSMAGFVPYLFLSVAALLFNLVLSRLVQLQRGIIATLKAVGYPDRGIALHYLKLVSLIVFAGALLGVGFGVWGGRAMMGLYTGEYFRFADPKYTLKLSAILFSVGVSFVVALLGAFVSVRSVAKMPPAEAMQPPAPAKYRRSFLERLGLFRFLGPNVRMIAREVSRKPLRLLLSALGISLALGILVVARSMWDSMEYLIDVQFHRSMREDLNVTLARPVDHAALASLRHIPGVYRVEGIRSVPVRFVSGHRYRDSMIAGYASESQLRRLIDGEGRMHFVPENGIVLTRKLGEILGVDTGEEVHAEVREGDFRSVSIRVAGLVGEPFGLAGHMDRNALARLLGDTGPINTALLVVDRNRVGEVEERLKAMSLVVGVSSPHDFKRQFDEQSVAMMGVFTFIMTLFACIIAVGVIYNNARVALSQRNRDLASLRVLGFTKGEISTILFGEQAVQVALAIPIGLWIGKWMAVAMMSNADPETYRLPVMVSPATYAFSVAVAIASAVLSGLLLRRKLMNLDLIGVLKTRE
jgi:putative ABC transport system permease protein